MKKCELCGSVARMYCDSDKASLCWECDSTVHTANFIVAKHARTLLCHACQSPTPWTGSGPRLGPTVSVCPSCLSATQPINRPRRNGNTTADEDASGHESRHDDDDDDGENQVVPLPSLPPSFASTSSSGGETSSDPRGGRVSGSFHPTALSIENTRFSHDSVERREEKSSSLEKMRPRTWRWR